MGSLREDHSCEVGTRRSVLRPTRWQGRLPSPIRCGPAGFGALVAGISRMRWEKFALYNLLGGTVWVSAIVSLGYFLWASISLVEHWVGRASLLLLAVLALALLLRWTYRSVTRV